MTMYRKGNPAGLPSRLPGMLMTVYLKGKVFGVQLVYGSRACQELF